VKDGDGLLGFVQGEEFISELRLCVVQFDSPRRQSACLLFARNWIHIVALQISDWLYRKEMLRKTTSPMTDTALHVIVSYLERNILCDSR
jgi:hypothetical protein